MKVEEAIKLINDAENPLYSIEEATFYIEYNKLLASNVAITKYDWYEVSSSYYQLEDGILGIRGVSKVYDDDEPVGFYDVEIPCCVFVGTK